MAFPRPDSPKATQFLDQYEPVREDSGSVSLVDYFSQQLPDSVFPLPLVTQGHIRRLVESGAGGERVEVTFRLQGVLLDARLPSPRMPIRNPSMLKQSVRIGGCGSRRFHTSIGHLRCMVSCVACSLPQDSMHTWTPLDHDGEEVLLFSNRYFTSKTVGKDGSAVQFHSSVDPTGALALAAGLCLVHTEDNIVEYLELRGEKVYEYPPRASMSGTSSRSISR